MSYTFLSSTAFFVLHNLNFLIDFQLRNRTNFKDFILGNNLNFIIQYHLDRKKN